MASRTDSYPDAKSCYSDDSRKENRSVGLVLFESMKKYKDSILQYIADTDEIDTNGQVLTRSIRTAIKLKEKGVTRDDIVSICTYKQKNACVPMVASLFLGVKVENFDPTLSRMDTIHLLKLTQPKFMFVSTESVSFMEKCLEESGVKSELVVFGYSNKHSQFSEYLEPNPEEDNFRPVTINDSRETAMILFSSGTTGFPKGICLSHYSLLMDLNPEKNFFQTKHGKGKSISLLYTTFYWISAVLFFIKSVADGASVVICSAFDAFNTWRIIEKYKVTVLFLAPHLANEFLNNRPEDADTSSLQLLLMGGSAVPSKLMENLTAALPHIKVFQGYGQTEAACAILFFDPGDPDHVDMQIRKPLSCGKVRPELLWKVVDTTSEETLGPNRRGELRLKSDFLMNGYYKMDSSSAYDSQGYLKTGDIVYYDEEECFYIVDRIKEMFKYKGWHILPAVLEKVLMNHPAVKEALVIGIPHETDGEAPMGIVVLNEGFKHVTPKDIELFVEEKVSDNQRFRAGVKIVKEILKTATSKLRRNDMKKMVLNGEI